jgi:hypothetical protein
MMVEGPGVENYKRMRLRVTSEADPGALSRILAHFQNLNVIPQRVLAELGSTGLMHIEVDVTSLTEARLTLIAAKIAQVVSVSTTNWHHL